MKIALCIGHNSINQGAKSLYLNESEWVYNKEIAECMDDVCDIYYRSNGGGYKNEIKRLANQVNQKDYDLVMEMHYNAAVPEASGCEALYFHSSIKGKEYAEKFCQTITQNYLTKNRGAKPVSSENQRGYYFLQKMKAPAIILEPFFGTNNEALLFKDKYLYEQILRKYIIEL